MVATQKPSDDVLEYIRNNLDYVPDTGELYKLRIKTLEWVVCNNIGPGGRYVVKIRYKNYSHATIAWFLYYKEWPEFEVDHKDRNNINDRIDNLRLATTSQNAANVDVRKTNKYHGVCFNSLKKTYQYHFRRWGGRVQVAGFLTDVAAAKAREEHLNELGDTFCVRNPNLE